MALIDQRGAYAASFDTQRPVVPPLKCNVVHDDEGLREMEDGVSEEFLQHFCSTDDLDTVEKLEIQVDSVSQDLSCLGIHLPNLRHLKLNDSNINCIRDLGTSLSVLEVLWMSRCSLQDIQGVACLESLKELYVSFNHVVDVSPLQYHDSIEVLDLEGNAVESLQDVLCLNTCGSLRELTLMSNPVCKAETFSREAILDAIPTLEILDDIEVDPEAPLNLGDLSHLPATSKILDRASDLGLPLPSFSDKDSEHSEHSENETDIQRVVTAGSTASTATTPAFDASDKAPLCFKKVGKEMWDYARTVYCDEPDEVDLMLEALKGKGANPARGGQGGGYATAFTARPSTTSRFGFSLTERPHARTATSTCLSMNDPGTFRPATAVNSGLDFDAFRGDEEATSDLTSGDALVGNPLRVARQKRVQTSHTGSSAAPMDIRSLLRRYQTLSQASCLSEDALETRQLAAGLRTLGPPDVRIHGGEACDDDTPTSPTYPASATLRDRQSPEELNEELETKMTARSSKCPAAKSPTCGGTTPSSEAIEGMAGSPSPDPISPTIPKPPSSGNSGPRGRRRVSSQKVPSPVLVGESETLSIGAPVDLD